MGSRLLRNTVLVTVIMLGLILVVVLLGNRSDLQKETAKQQVASEESSTAVQGELEVESNKQVGADLSAFLSDDSFFDQEDHPAQMTVQYGRTADLVVTSVDRDIRIHIVDIVGNLITGEDFCVSLKGSGQYRDSDQDGIIYISPVKPGDYQVSLELIDRYKVPQTATPITVKQTISYTAIEDIEVLILTEKEVDATKEDRQLAAADIDEDDSERTDLRTENESAQLGIDVSKWNQEIDWKQVKEAGIDFAIIRCGYRGSETGARIEDPLFADNISGALEAGISVGVYFFSQAVNEAEAVEEASTVLSLCKGYPLTYPVYIDSESANGIGRADDLDIKARTDICKAFCETIQNAGYDSGIYASRSWFEKQLDDSALEDYSIWLAEYREIPQYQGYYEMWQYTAKGRIPGIEGNVDLNLGYFH